MGDSVEMSWAKLPIKDQSIQGGRPPGVKQDRCEHLSLTCTLSAKGQSSILKVLRTYLILEYYTFAELNLGCTHFCNLSFNQNWLIYLSYRNETKMRLYRSLILPITLYGCEAWRLRSAEDKKKLLFEMAALRKILGVCIIDKMRNDDIRKALNQTEMIMQKFMKENISGLVVYFAWIKTGLQI